MSLPHDTLTPEFAVAASSAEKAKPPKPASTSVVTLRLTTEERAKLEELAAGMKLSSYIRACMFAQETKRRKTRPASTIEDNKAAAEALALLGQSRIASNLNQLAYHANIGALLMGNGEIATLNEACAHLKAIRSTLMVALGRTRAPSGKKGPSDAASRDARTRPTSLDPKGAQGRGK